MQKYCVEVYDNGDVYWYKFETNVFHRENGPAVELVDGSKAYFINGKLHNEDGPAVEYTNGHKEYYINGKCHREDGPAVEYPNGHKAYFINGKEYSFAEWQKKVKELQSTTCEGKVVEIEGKKYKLTEIK